MGPALQGAGRPVGIRQGDVLKRPAREKTRPTAPIAVLALGIAALAGCTNEGDTVVVNGLDCGLVRADLAGDWVVTYLPDSATLQNCSDGAFNNRIVDVTGTSVVYHDVAADASASGAAFTAIGAGPNRSDELVANVQADSCLALVQTWEQDDQGWVQCLGTLDLVTNALGGICDSMDFDTSGDGIPDVACDLSHSFQMTVGTPP